MRTIVLTGGGTAGHVTPHLALIPELKKRGYEIHYIGTENGIEHEMMNRVEGLAELYGSLPRSRGSGGIGPDHPQTASRRLLFQGRIRRRSRRVGRVARESARGLP